MDYGKRMLMAIFALVAVGCQTLPEHVTVVPGPRMAAAPLPGYVPGEFFEFSNGVRYTVAAVEGKRVRWRSDSGTRYRRHANFVLPDIERRSETSITRTTVSGDPGVLWPLGSVEKGYFRSASLFTREGEVQSINPVERDWYCRVEGTRKVAVRAGRFDTYAIECRRDSRFGGWRGTRTFYYAPAVGYYVLRVDRRPGRAASYRELVRHGFRSGYLPRAERRALRAVLLQALEANPDGQASAWRASSGRVAVRVVPTRSYAGQRGERCREYHSIYSIEARQHRNVRQMCRQPDGAWKRVG